MVVGAGNVVTTQLTTIVYILVGAHCPISHHLRPRAFYLVVKIK